MRNFLFLNFAEALKRREYVGWSLRLQKNTDNGQRPETARYAAVVCDRDQKAARAKEEYKKCMCTVSTEWFIED